MDLSLYLDSSVVVALLTDDALHVRADGFLRGETDALLVSDLVAAEFASALARQVRVAAILPEQARAGFFALDIWMARYANLIEIDTADIAVASAFLRRLDLPLKTPDAIHIAAAQRIGARLVTFSRQMAASARILGIEAVTP